MVSVWWSFTLSFSESPLLCLWDRSVDLVPVEALMLAPMMIVLFLVGILLRNSENSWVDFSISSWREPE